MYFNLHDPYSIDIQWYVYVFVTWFLEFTKNILHQIKLYIKYLKYVIEMIYVFIYYRYYKAYVFIVTLFMRPTYFTV